MANPLPGYALPLDSSPSEYLDRGAVTVKNRLISTTLAALAGVGLVSSIAACGGQVATAEVGECVVTADIPDDVTDIPTVDCSEPHDGQVVGKFELDDGDYPGDDAVQTAAQEGCLTEFESFVGIAYEESSLEPSWVYPTEQTWNEVDDREVICFAISAEDATESWEGAAI